MPRLRVEVECRILEALGLEDGAPLEELVRRVAEEGLPFSLLAAGNGISLLGG